MWQCLQLGVPVVEINRGDFQWGQEQRTPPPQEGCGVLGPMLPDALHPRIQMGVTGATWFSWAFSNVQMSLNV